MTMVQPFVAVLRPGAGAGWVSNMRYPVLRGCGSAVVCDAPSKFSWSSDRTAASRDQLKFERLANEWRRSTRLHSNVSKKVSHQAYQSVIGMGPSAIPLILRDLAKHGPDDWFWALSAITEENPITAEMSGKMDQMTEAWLKWGKDRGYLVD